MKQGVLHHEVYVRDVEVVEADYRVLKVTFVEDSHRYLCLFDLFLFLFKDIIFLANTYDIPWLKEYMFIP